MQDIRLSGNPVADIGKGGVPRFVFIARIAKLEVLNGSEVKSRYFSFLFSLFVYFWVTDGGGML